MAHKFHLRELNGRQRRRLNGLITEHVTEEVIRTHTEWHTLIGARDREFFDFHRRFIAGLETFISNQKISSDERHVFLPLPVWNPSDPIPDDFPFNPTNPIWERINSNPNIPFPSYYTLAGGDIPAPRFGYRSLKEFLSADQLAESILTSGYHDRTHIRVGGAMADFANSPRDPIFWLWHSWIDDIYSNYQATLVMVPNVVGMSTNSFVLNTAASRGITTTGSLSRLTAQQTIVSAGFKIGTITRTVETVPVIVPENVGISETLGDPFRANFALNVNSVVAAQSPAGGSEAPIGAKVDLIELVYLYVPRRGSTKP